jgi:hypothetical protein
LASLRSTWRRNPVFPSLWQGQYYLRAQVLVAANDKAKTHGCVTNGYKGMVDHERSSMALALPDMRSIRDTNEFAVRHHLITTIGDAEDSRSFEVPGSRGTVRRVDFATCEVPPPPPCESLSIRRSARLGQARRHDFAKKDAANRRLGKAGERFAMAREHWFLITCGRHDLAARIEWTSVTKGDGAGYDIVSFDPADGEPIYIEVKTTNSASTFPFYVTTTEVQASAVLGDRYRLYRIFNFSTCPQFYQERGSLELHFQLVPKDFEAHKR